MDDYQYDVFISHRRTDPETIQWVTQNFLRPLRACLNHGLEDGARVFIDDTIEAGATWPDGLARAHACSKILIPLFSVNYFSSDWCRLELALMKHREKQTGFRTDANPSGLVIPFTFFDGDCFPDEIQEIQSIHIHDHFIPCMTLNGQRQEEFAACLARHAHSIVTAVKNAPPFDPSWKDFSHDHFRDLYRLKIGRKNHPAGAFAH